MDQEIRKLKKELTAAKKKNKELQKNLELKTNSKIEFCFTAQELEFMVESVIDKTLSIYDQLSFKDIDLKIQNNELVKHFNEQIQIGNKIVSKLRFTD